VVVRLTLQAASGLSKVTIPARSNRLNIVFFAFIDFTHDDFSDTV
jgi:hypothetical protein